MAKRIASTILVLLASVLVVMSFVVPHHHHADSTVICLESNCSDGDCCGGDPVDRCSDTPTGDHPHNPADDSGCSLESNLLIHSGDSRRPAVSYDCGSGFALPPVTVDIPTPWVGSSLFKHEYPPYSFSYRSKQAVGTAALRAPPSA